MVGRGREVWCEQASGRLGEIEGRKGEEGGEGRGGKEREPINKRFLGQNMLQAPRENQSQSLIVVISGLPGNNNLQPQKVTLPVA